MAEGISFGVGGYFGLAGNHAGILLGMLPPIVHIRKESDKAALRWSMERMMQELREPQPGGFLVVQHLAHMMLVQALRLHLAEGLSGGVGWLFALADKQMGAAISAMHDDPAHRWTLQELAERVGMSRSSFALKFKETVGASPIGLPDALANAAGRGQAGEFQRSHFRHRPARSATNPKAPSAPPSRGSWAVRRGNMAVAGLRLRLHTARGKPPAPIGSNPSLVDERRIGKGKSHTTLRAASAKDPANRARPLRRGGDPYSRLVCRARIVSAVSWKCGRSFRIASSKAIICAVSNSEPIGRTESPSPRSSAIV